MGFFDRIKKKRVSSEEPKSVALENYPEMLVVKLLFQQRPSFNPDNILTELRKSFININKSEDVNGIVFGFPDIQYDLIDINAFAQCLIAPADTSDNQIDIPETSLQQNWHWKEANDAVKGCTYSLIVSDLLTRTLEYKKRLNLFMTFLVTVIKVTKPEVVLYLPAQKLIQPQDLIEDLESNDQQILSSLCNVRLYNITERENQEFLMDTIGLNSLGLPDFQIRFSDQEVNEIAKLLWNYAYYTFEHGDIIENGNTLEGIEIGSKWICQREFSLIQPKRTVLNIIPQ